MSGGLPRVSRCRDCGSPIRFVRLEGKSRMLPVDATPLTAGTREWTKANVAGRALAGRLSGFVVSRDRLPGPLYPLRFTPHHATCPARQPKPTPAAADDRLFD